MAKEPDPSELSDEELDKKLEDLNPAEPDDEDPEDKQDEPEPESDEEPEPEDEGPTPDPEKEPEKEEPKPSPREQTRIRNLLQKYGDPDKPEKPKTFEGALDYEKDLDADPETRKRLQDDRDKVTGQAFNFGLEQAKSLQFNTRLEIDAPRVEAKYPQLDKNNTKEFKPEAANDVNTMYLTLAGYDTDTGMVQNPNIRYAEFVDSIFSLANDLASQKAAETTRNIKRQASQTGLRPDGSRTKKLDLTKPPEQMSDEELDAFIAQNVPTK